MNPLIRRAFTGNVFESSYLKFPSLHITRARTACMPISWVPSFTYTYHKPCLQCISNARKWVPHAPYRSLARVSKRILTTTLRMLLACLLAGGPTARPACLLGRPILTAVKAAGQPALASRPRARPSVARHALGIKAHKLRRQQ